MSSSTTTTAERLSPAVRPNAAFDIAIAGELNLDFILYGLSETLPPERELLANDFTMTLGSSSAITAHNMAALGSRVAFLSKVGLDAIGEICCERLRERGVDVSGVKRSVSGQSTGASFLLPLPGKSTRRILTYPGVMFEMGPEDVDEQVIATSRHFHLSAFFLHRKLKPHLPALFARAKAQGLTTSLDTNDDPDDAWEEPLFETLRHVDILLCNEREIRKIAGLEDAEAAAKKIASTVPLLVVKCGDRGAKAYMGDRVISVPGVRITVVDSIGAGDSFNAGFLHRWLKGASLEECMAFGNLTGAFSTTRPGGTEAFRDADYLKAFLEEHGENL